MACIRDPAYIGDPSCTEGSASVETFEFNFRLVFETRRLLLEVLRYSSTTNFAMPRLRTKCGERAFSHAGPAAWNALPEDMRAVSDCVLFRKRLKTHPFSVAFNVC